VFQPDYQAGTAPKLDVVAIDKALRPLGRLGIVGANQRLEIYDVPAAQCRKAYPNSSSSAFASLRSGVSKPSVNQL
jgi:hypothetical protein